ncbi:hypothetical protein GOP47_0012687 [Adiantum capillus-veneris]|uniref:Uncharacterized protein n=1 Tax=Adiantum capillus-veneris TaxID=13818 RepID=A0A9D4ZH22_ADICA|nr:hypothetical protein GOP47_0012687 [Adiantum capillus-veneris]
MAIGRDEVVKGAAVTAVAFWLLQKLARDIGREAERLGHRTRADVESGKAVEAIRAETDLLLDKVCHTFQSSLHQFATSSRLHCKLHGASLVCEIEPKDVPIHNIGLPYSDKDFSRKT